MIYQERQTYTTNNYGLANLEIGKRTGLFGAFNTINWALGQMYLKVELDPAGGTTYLNMGTSQLLSTPYALYSEKTGQTYTGGTGINVTGTIITNTAPDQTVGISGGTGISTSGTYPNFTVTNTAPNATHTGDATGGSRFDGGKITGQNSFLNSANHQPGAAMERHTVDTCHTFNGIARMATYR